MKPARAILQNGVAVNVSRHHLRQRAIVRRSMGHDLAQALKPRIADAVLQMVISTTMVAT
jgi:hypothetical protein